MRIRKAICLGLGIIVALGASVVLIGSRPAPLPKALEPFARVTRLIHEQQVQAGTGYTVIRMYSVQAPATEVLPHLDHDEKAVDFGWHGSPQVRLVGLAPQVVANTHRNRLKTTGQTLWAARVEVDQGQKLLPGDAQGWTCFVDMSQRLETPFEEAEDTVRGWFGTRRMREDPEPDLVVVSDPTANLRAVLAMRRKG